MLTRIFLLSVLIYTFCISNVIEFEELHSNKTIIQLGTFKNQNNIERIKRTLSEENRDIYLLTINDYNIAYVVNISNENKQQVLQSLKETYKDAFINPKAYYTIVNNYGKNTQQNSTSQNETTNEKNTPLPEPQTEEQTNENNIALEELDSSKTIVQIGTFKSQTSIKRIKHSIPGEKQTIYLLKNDNYTIAYAVNIPPENKNTTLKNIRKTYKDAFINSKAYNYISNSFNKSNIIHTTTPKKKQKVKKDITETTSPKKETNIENNVEEQRHFQMIVRKGVTSFNQEDFVNAYWSFKKAYEINSSYAKLNFYLARSAYEVKEYEEALNIYKELLQQDPNSLQLNLEIAKTYNKLKQYEKSKQHFLESYK